jgi:hypothetical protein
VKDVPLLQAEDGLVDGRRAVEVVGIERVRASTEIVYVLRHVVLVHLA